MRLILFQRKNYPGSTPYTSAEIDDLAQGRKIAIDRLGSILGQFIKYVIDKHHIPRTIVNGAGRRTGGVAVVGWSMGSVAALSLFSGCEDNLVTGLSPYIRDLILYGKKAPDLRNIFDLP